MPATARRPRLVTPAFLAIGFAALGYFLADGVLIPAVPRYVEGPLGGGEVAVGVSVGAFSVTALLLRPWAGRLADRRGRRPLMLIGTAVFALSVLGYLVATSVPRMIVLRLLSGIGEAFFFTGAASAIVDMAPEERRGEALSFFSLALYVGIGVGPLLGELALGPGRLDLEDARPAWLLAAAFAAAATVLVLFVRETVAPQRSDAEKPRLINPAALMPGLAILASVSAMSGYIAFVPLYSREVGLDSSSFVFLLYSGIVVLIRSFGARIPDVLGPVRCARIAMAISGAGLVVTALWATPVGLLIGTAIGAVGGALAFPALMSLAVGAAPSSERGSAVGTFTAFVDLAFGVGPATLGAAAEYGGYRAAFLVGGGVAFAGLALLLARYRGEERR